MVAVVLFNRDLRVHDNLALAEATSTHDAVIPLFVFDERIIGSQISRHRIELRSYSTASATCGHCSAGAEGT